MIKFQINILILNKVTKLSDCLSKSTDECFESPTPGSLSPPPGYETLLMPYTFIIHSPIHGFTVTKVN